MAQVTIYLEEGTLAAAKVAASRAQVSVSKWFAQFAEAEQRRAGNDWADVFAQIDALKHGADGNALDFLADSAQRHADLGVDAPRDRAA